MNLRVLARALAGIVTTLALVLGLGGLQAAQADTTPTAAQHCQQERQDVRAAKVKVKKAKKAKKKAVKAKKAKAVKKADKRLKKARKNLERQRAQASRWCSRAKSEAAADAQGEETRGGLQAVLDDPALAQLPPTLRTALESAVTATQTQVDALLGQVPGASSDELAHLVNQLSALDPAALQAAVQELAAQLAVAGGDPAALTTLVESLLAGGTLPVGSDLEDLAATLQSVFTQLNAFDPSTTSPDALAVALGGLTDELATSAPQLTTLFATLAGLAGGELPSDPTGLLDLIGGFLGL